MLSLLTATSKIIKYYHLICLIGPSLNLPPFISFISTAVFLLYLKLKKFYIQSLITDCVDTSLSSFFCLLLRRRLHCVSLFFFSFSNIVASFATFPVYLFHARVTLFILYLYFISLILFLIVDHFTVSYFILCFMCFDPYSWLSVE